MNSNTSSGHSRSAPSVGPKPSGLSAESVSKQAEAEIGHDSLNELRRDVASLADTVTRFASQVGGDAAKTVRSVGQTVASQVGGAASGVADAGSDLASSAAERAKTFASELEGMARRNPLGTIAGALLVGVVIGMMSRGRG